MPKDPKDIPELQDPDRQSQAESQRELDKYLAEQVKNEKTAQIATVELTHNELHVVLFSMKLVDQVNERDSAGVLATMAMLGKLIQVIDPEQLSQKMFTAHNELKTEDEQ